MAGKTPHKAHLLDALLIRGYRIRGSQALPLLHTSGTHRHPRPQGTNMILIALTIRPLGAPLYHTPVPLAILQQNPLGRMCRTRMVATRGASAPTLPREPEEASRHDMA
jgi:hypothetical protein